MRRAAAAALLLCALAVRAQTPPPDTAPAAPPEQAAPAALPAAQPATPPAEQPAAPPVKAAAVKAAPKQPPQAAQAVQEPPAPGAPAAELLALRAQVSRLQAELDAERAASLAPLEPAAAPQPALMWGWLALAVVLALGAGFALGWRILDRRIRRRYGGLRIY